MKAEQTRKYNQRQGKKINISKQKYHSRSRIINQTCCMLQNPQQWKAINIKKSHNRQIVDQISQFKLNIMSLSKQSTVESSITQRDESGSSFSIPYKFDFVDHPTKRNLNKKIKNGHNKKYIKLSLKRLQYQEKTIIGWPNNTQIPRKQHQQLQSLKREFFEYLYLHNEVKNMQHANNSPNNNITSKYSSHLNSIQEVERRFQGTQISQISAQEQ